MGMRWSKAEDRETFLELRVQAKVWVDTANKPGAAKEEAGGPEFIELSLRNAHALAAVAELYRGNDGN